MLPEEPPYRDARRRAIWDRLRKCQAEYRDPPDKWSWHDSPRDFSKLVKMLHGSEGPWWARPLNDPRELKKMGF